jgi:hypothetical protein
LEAGDSFLVVALGLLLAVLLAATVDFTGRFLLLTPNVPLFILPFLVFLSPFPIWFLVNVLYTKNTFFIKMTTLYM